MSTAITSVSAQLTVMGSGLASIIIGRPALSSIQAPLELVLFAFPSTKAARPARSLKEKQ
jgi:hypothetical protein